MKNINEYFKDIDLRIIFLIKFMKKEKIINYFDNFFIYFMKIISKLLLNDLLLISIRHHLKGQTCSVKYS